MGKGEETRLAVLDEAARVARGVGLGGLTIGTLAERTALSKSGLFGHFKSKESLQLQVLQHARARFVDQVVRPALGAPRGEPRLRVLFDGWLRWEAVPGGCLFVTAAAEFHHQPGAVRDEVVRGERDMTDMIMTMFRAGIADGAFRGDVDPEQCAYEFNGVLLAFHQGFHLLEDERSERRARQALDALLDRVRS
ncbi:TetR/AcrR family transcriptional regulator [Dactylosporangium siamense]|uniref:TetR family transcriptional regulator n=1 Tax=Dactylosporangium siamense TaxID=685454 RepID=A0A919PPB2_9ACTN|nr:TetR/AcrR family transcriptional regulator [Dactylosporangium siamense]GIG48420.1 TetR family transcriptional regulator [Dactylosporangium siamense]